MNIALWIVQALLALAFLAAGSFKTFTPGAELAAQMPWIADSGVWVARLAGVSEILGALGLILPSALRIMPRLTVAAAAALALVMVLAAGVHGMRAEYSAIVPNMVLMGLSVFVAWGRAKKVVITPRS